MVNRIRPLDWVGDRLRILDQTALPDEERYLEATTPKDVVRAIRRLAVRGAPLLGIAAAYGMALATIEGEDVPALRAELERAGRSLVNSRPTAVNIVWAVDRVRAAAADARDLAGIREAVLAE
ncbi:MAG TPA: S-methyl-5-thioribose-1-phosphate isomerase, partial [Actinomycetota bacterium]|nr:S-methyl-5-thioribose-1-phosphate isomerase [Actinomycetota bacterium]